MKMGIFGTKVGMTQVFNDKGDRLSVTVLKINKNVVVDFKKKKSDGYDAIRVGYGYIKKKRINKPTAGVYKKNEIDPKKFLKEHRITENYFTDYKIGTEIGLELFKNVKLAHVVGRSKGKGFAGVMKRYNFSGFRKSHGTHESFRGGGSIGMCTKPGKVFKGKKMPGRMGNDKKTIKNLKIIKIIEDKRIVLLKGSVPGGKNNVVLIIPVKKI